ncbi:MAG TPA: hypothetical protein VK203_01015 [Nostocaceae cyanobacterium]|nr:hypothetical protein [Nostocaceae cyanobacterium]
MAKGFGKSITNNKLSRYAPLTKNDKTAIRALETMTDCVYGEDFVLHHRIRRIYIKKKVSLILNNLRKDLDSSSQPSTLEALRMILDVTEITDSIDEAEFAMLVTEALMWQAYKLLHNGDEPRIEKDLCFYSQEELLQIDGKINDMPIPVNSPEKLLEEVVTPFLKYLKKQGYFYHFTHYKMIARDGTKDC